MYLSIDILLHYYDVLLKGSMNQKDWVMLVNHKLYFCRSWQYLYFDPRVVLYIRIVGTNNTVNKVSFPEIYMYNQSVHTCINARISE